MSLLPENFRTRRVWRSATIGMLAAATATAFACSDEPLPVQDDLTPQYLIPIPPGSGYDLNDFDLSPVTIDGAIWTFPVPANVGTGNIDPFLSIQNNPDEEGFNTDGSPLPLNTKRPTFTDALPLNNIPVIKVNDILYREIIFDANESNSVPDAQFSLDRFDLYICLDETPFSINTVTTIAGFASNPDCQLIYDPFSPPNDLGFATDAATQGSGQALDYQILIPNANFDAFNVGGVTIDDCPYNPSMPPCGLWVILHAEMGHFGGDWITNATFDEFSTVLQPFVTLSKTAVPEFTRRYLWEIEKDVDPEVITLFDGQNQDADYEVVVTQTGTEDSNWKVSGTLLITNPSSQDATISDFEDFLTPGPIDLTGDVDCGVTIIGYLIEAGETLECTYEHTFGGDPGVGPFVNNMEVELEGLAVSTAMSDPFSFTTPTEEIDKMVDVEDNVQGTLDTDIITGDTYNYTINYECDAEEGTWNNIASVIGDDDVVLDTDDASVVVNCLDVTVTKTVDTELVRTYNWLIDKAVTPDTWALFDGDDGTSEYTITLTPDGFDDDAWMVSGEIEVTNVANTNSLPVFIQDVTDVISPAIAATVNCPVTFPHSLASGATLTCTYGPESLPDGSTRTNTATATAWPTSGGSAFEEDFDSDAETVSFTGATLTEVDETVDVTDTWPDGSVVIDDALHEDAGGQSEYTYVYSRTFDCGADAGTHDNTAEIVETGQTDDASVTVTCYDLTVDKDADTEWRRDWTWDIDKTGSETNLTIAAGQNFVDVFYTVVVSATSIEYGYMVEGDIDVTNNHPSLAATLNSVTDLVTPEGVSATVECGVSFPHDLAAGATLNCTYSADLSDESGGTNTATATQQNHSYDKDGVGTPSGTTDYEDDAAVVFGDPIETDECVDVSDTHPEFGETTEVCASNSPFEFQFDYTVMVGGYEVCGVYEVPNTADFITNDTETTGDDSWLVIVDVPCEGCTLTPGYWKTHNDSFVPNGGGSGPPTDDTWLQILPNAEQTGFFTTDGANSYPTTGPNAPPFTWFEVFWTDSGQNKYYTLAHHYMAAKLNVLNGAGSAVDAEIAAAEALFAVWTPEQIGDMKGNDPVRKEFISLASTLAKFNEGTIGPGHCDEDSTSTLLLGGS